MKLGIQRLGISSGITYTYIIYASYLIIIFNIRDLCSRIDSIEPDKTLLASLRHIRTTLLGEQLDLRVKVIKRQLQSTPVGSQIVLKLSANGKLKFLVTALLDIGSHLSQSREFKGLIEDIVVKVTTIPPLFFSLVISINLFLYDNRFDKKIGDVFEETGFTIFETNMFLISCLSLIDYAPGSASRMSTFEAASSSRRNSGLPDMQMAASSISAVSSTGILRDSPPSLLTGTSNSVSGNGSVNPSFVSHSANNSGRSYRGDNISSGSFSTSTKGGPVEVFRDWCRFISCVRLCLEQLAALKPYR
jgi:hypothetical protein